MKILLDANLSYRLVKKLQDVYPECLHVSKTGLPIPAADAAIWQWARNNDYILIVTNDEDFKTLAEISGTPPKIVLLRMGNQSTNSLAQVLKSNYEALIQLCESAEIAILELY